MMVVTITVDGTPKEIAALALELQERQGNTVAPKEVVDAITRQLHRQASQGQAQ